MWLISRLFELIHVWGTKGLVFQASVLAASVSVAGVATVSILLITGITSALDARDQFDILQEELSSRGLNDFRDEETYRALTEEFKEAERLAGQARSRLQIAGVVSWVPVLGNKIEEYRAQLDLAYYLARAGHGLADSYQTAFAAADATGPEALFTQALENAAPKFAQVEDDLKKVEEIRNKLKDSDLNESYLSLIDTYLPQIQALAFISSEQPGVIGEAYELNLKLDAVQGLVSDPLEVLSSPDEVGGSLDRIIEGAHRLAAELESLALTVSEKESQGQEAPKGIEATINFMAHGVGLLEQSAQGARGLLELTLAADAYGFLTVDYAGRALAGLEQADRGLTLAREELRVMDQLLAVETQEGNGSDSLLGFGVTSALSSTSLSRTGEILDTAIETARFLKTSLGFEGPRSYLLLIQNQQEIKATGGFIGQVALLKVNQGVLDDLVFQDSTQVDFAPPLFSTNPPPPEPVYWYLWMDRMLFRDANWSPHFPVSSVAVADLYRLGQGVQVDGVIAASKKLFIEMVESFGDITVPGLPGPLTREIVEAYSAGGLPYECAERHASTSARRCFDEDAFFALKDRLTSPVPAEQRTSLVSLFRRELAKKNILAHIFDINEGRLLWELGWNGAIPPVDHDYLSVIDSSFASHSAERVFRTLKYQVSLEVDRPIESKLWVQFDHRAEINREPVCRQASPEPIECFWNYFRIYLPAVAEDVVVPPVPIDQGAEKLIWGYPDPDSLSLGLSADVGPAALTEIGGLIAVPPDSVTTVPITYQLPWDIVRSLGNNTYEYRLLVQKQSGIDQDLVKIWVELPPGSELTGISPNTASRSGRWIIFEFPLKEDTQVAVSFRVP